MLIIYVKLEGYNFEYEIHDVLRLFFSEKEIIYIELDPPPDYEGAFLLCSVTGSEDKLMLEINLSDREYRYSERMPIGKVPAGENKVSVGIEPAELFGGCFACTANNLEMLRTARKRIKRQVYLILANYTGKSLPWGVLTGVRPVKIAMEMLDRGSRRREIISELKEYYLLSDEKAELLLNIAQTERVLLEKTASDMVSLYIGIPFCPSRCLYCSFTSYSINKYGYLMESYLEALKAEILAVNRILKEKSYKIQSIYIGGGTPTSLDAALLEELLEFIEANLELTYLEEYTLEAGRPDSIDLEKLKVIKNSRVDRISINPQTMNDYTLEVIGRRHTVEDVVRVFRLARVLGFENINMDIIIGLPGENFEMFEKTLREISQLGPESLTVHTMAVKRASRLREDREKYSLITENEASAMVKMAQEYALSMSMHPYYLYRQKNMLGNLENVGYCKLGFESIYNIQIMEERQTIIAVGAGATTKVVYPEENRIERAFNVKDVEEYIRRVDEMVKRKRVLL